MKVFYALVLSIFTHVALAGAGAPLERASKAYLEKGVESFIPTLLKGSPVEGEKSVLAQSNSIRQIETFYGAYQGYELIYEKALTSKIRLVYYVMNYQKSPVFGVVTYYKRGTEEVVTNFNVHTDMNQIVPKEVLFK